MHGYASTFVVVTLRGYAKTCVGVTLRSYASICVIECHSCHLFVVMTLHSYASICLIECYSCHILFVVMTLHSYASICLIECYSCRSMISTLSIATPHQSIPAFLAFRPLAIACCSRPRHSKHSRSKRDAEAHPTQHASRRGAANTQQTQVPRMQCHFCYSKAVQSNWLVAVHLPTQDAPHGLVGPA